MKTNKGFSLVELIVVIAIMAIIAGVAIPVYTNYIDKAEKAVIDNAVAEIERAFAIECINAGIDKPTLEVDGILLTVTFSEAKDVNYEVVTAVEAIVANYIDDEFVVEAEDFSAYTATLVTK